MLGLATVAAYPIPIWSVPCVGGDASVLASMVKYSDLVANAIMLHNVSDLTNVLDQLATEGRSISEECVASLSPYIRDQIRRFGQYNGNYE